MLALVLGHPRDANPSPAPANPSPHPNPNPTLKEKKCLIPSRATLIIVPTTLMSQWWKEIHTRVDASSGLQCVCITDERLFNSTEVQRGDVRCAGGGWGTLPATGLSSEPCEVRVPWCTKTLSCESGTPRAGPSRLFTCFKSLREQLHDFDIVITNYESLRGRSAALLKKIDWHRVVLDECQEIKVPTNQIAVNCAMLASRNRWMVSGTPLCSSINDLHGELNFLQVKSRSSTIVIIIIIIIISILSIISTLITTLSLLLAARRCGRSPFLTTSMASGTPVWPLLSASTARPRCSCCTAFLPPS